MLSAFTNCFKIPELRQRILLTLGLIFIARVGAGIPLPGLDPSPLQAYYASSASDAGGLVGLYNMFTGGAMVNGAIFALGIMPYISASIILQLMGAVMPSLARLMQEGDSGRQKIAQYTRYLTIVIAFIQGTMITYALAYTPETIFSGFNKEQFGSIIVSDNMAVFFIVSVVLMTTGCMVLTWLGEQITQRGIGNGVSIIITVGIIDTLPGACSQAWSLVFERAAGAESAIGVPQAIVMLVLLGVVTASIIMILQAVRKVPVQYAKRVVGRKIMGGQSSYLPLKVNYAGVMPIIFASALLLFPQQIFGQFNISTYSLVYGGLVFVFSYFWVSIMFKPLQISDELKRNSGYIPGVRPGENTAQFLDYVMTRLTFAGACFLVIIAVLPQILMTSWGIPSKIANFFGGTGALIAVGVSLDTMRQVETYLLQRHYDGFLKKGRIRGRSVGQTRQMLDTSEIKNLWALWTPLTIILVVGLVAWAIRSFA
ncbi:MAG: preprotein translocase subunit SecY [Verrucomicrobiaceae bacterium]|nr:preprotein translocase subunit SecY [Verrucomicrobiaceae bacterium]